jgi:hypothetical protein
VLLTLIAAAAGSYMIGFMPGLGLFLLLGMCFELAFWFKLFKPKHQNKAKN